MRLYHAPHSSHERGLSPVDSLKTRTHYLQKTALLHEMALPSIT